jgi:hypothetical protein
LKITRYPNITKLFMYSSTLKSICAWLDLFLWVQVKNLSCMEYCWGVRIVTSTQKLQSNSRKLVFGRDFIHNIAFNFLFSSSDLISILTEGNIKRNIVAKNKLKCSWSTILRGINPYPKYIISACTSFGIRNGWHCLFHQ